MPGTKGKSGGARSGAGRPQSTKKISVGDSFAAVRHYPDGGFEMLPIATISELGRNLIIITLSDGSEIRLAK